ncbi:MAG: glycosyl hydrolase [Solirubrobacterales bacterium]
MALAAAALLCAGAVAVALAGQKPCGKRPACGHRGHQAAKTPLPPRFYGINPSYGIPTDADFARMKAGGIASYRMPLYWSNVEYTRGLYDWNHSKVDVVIERATRAGLDVLPFLWGSPLWMNGDETVLPIKSAEQEQAWADFLKAVVHRYGPGGTFWAEHAPGSADPLAARPIRVWQIWNEENYHWFTYPASPGDYAKLLKVAAPAIHSVDPRAWVALGGVFGLPDSPYPDGMPAAEFLRGLYRVPGIRKTFDAVALHPYSSTAAGMQPLLAEVRRVMDAAGDRKKRIWVTEFGWGSAKPTSKNSILRGPQGQKHELVSAYRMLARNQHAWRIGRAYYFSWADSRSPHPCNLCATSGLFYLDGTPKPAWYGLVGLTGGKP